MDLQFDVDLDNGKEYWKAYRNQSMRAVSIGFRIRDYRVEEQNGTRIFISTKIELVEISCVAVGCNLEALSKLKGFEWVKDDEKQQPAPQELKGVIDNQFATLKTYITDQFDEIKDLIDCLIPGSDDDLSLPEAKELPSDPDDLSGQILDALKNILETKK